MPQMAAAANAAQAGKRAAGSFASALWTAACSAAGHGGPSGRYDAWREMAFYLAWQLRTLGVA